MQKQKTMKKTSSSPKKSASSAKKSTTNRGQQTTAPLAQTRLARTQVPSVSGSPYSGDGKIRIRHREYIGEVPGSVAFSNVAYPVNPGLSTVFPWLSTIALNYESYCFKSLTFEFETEKSASTNGAVMLAVDFDATDAAPVNKTALMSFHNAVRSAVWAECAYRASSQDLSKFGPHRYIRYGAAPTVSDLKTYDVGILHVATQGCADTTALGELYVTYDVEFETPQVNASAILASLSGSTGSLTAGVTRAAPFGSATTTVGDIATMTSATMTFSKVGQWLITYTNGGTVFTDTGPTLTGTATSSNLSIPVGHNTAATNNVGAIRVQVNNVGETLILDFTATATTITSGAYRFAGYLYSNGN